MNIILTVIVWVFLLWLTQCDLATYNCEWYKLKPVSEIPVRCIWYFD